MTETGWRPARLIPIYGIGGAEEQEKRATSALLAVMTAVKEFGRGIVSQVGAPPGKVEAFTEVQFALGEQKVIPDGVLRVVRGSRTWVALVEVKTGLNRLMPAQIEQYLDVAAQHGYQAVVTISNEMAPLAGTHPTSVDRRRLKKVELRHLSWIEVLTAAIVHHDHTGVADADQKWILNELIRYLEHPKSGALAFEDMGAYWVKVRDAVAAGTLRAADKGAADVASRWDQLIRYSCLGLGRQLGRAVEPTLNRKEIGDPALRAQALVNALCIDGRMEGALKIPDTVGPITLVADLRAGRISASIDIEAPRQGRAVTRVNWLVRQLKEAPDTVRVDCFALHARGSSTSELLRVLREDPARLVPDPKREPRLFRVTLTAPMGTKRGGGGSARGGFVMAVLDLVDGFYQSVVQNVKPWTASPPKLPPEPAEVEPVVTAAELVESGVTVERVEPTVVAPAILEPDAANTEVDDADAGDIGGAIAAAGPVDWSDLVYLFIPYDGPDDVVQAPAPGHGGIDLSRARE